MIEAIITDLLLNSMPSSVADAISDRVHPGILPQKCSYPAIRHQVISNPASERTSKAKQHSTKNSRYQIDIFARSYLEAATIATIIADQLDGYSATHDTTTIDLIEVVDTRPGYADKTETHHHIIELNLIWRKQP